MKTFRDFRVFKKTLLQKRKPGNAGNQQKVF